MRLSVSETAKLTGMTVRTLHYYDSIGILCPSEVTESGYRFYLDRDIKKLEKIMLYKELGFSLSEIGDLLECSPRDIIKAYERQKGILILKKERLDGIITLLENKIKGDTGMSFKEYDSADLENARKAYADEAKQKWGGTKEYAQSEERAKSYGKNEFDAINKEADAIFADFARLVGTSPSSEDAKALVGQWKAHISRYYYDCTPEILKCLGEMYTADERFTRNLDSYGEGTAKFMSDAIKAFCE